MEKYKLSRFVMVSRYYPGKYGNTFNAGHPKHLQFPERDSFSKIVGMSPLRFLAREQNNSLLESMIYYQRI